MYEHRFGHTTKRNDCRHDPSHHGIFIHGGTCNAGPFAPPKFLSTANKFGVTLPTNNRQGHELDWSRLAREGQRTIDLVNQPTFQRAVEFAKQLRRDIAELADCPIFACTDLQMDQSHAGRYAVQRVA